MREPMRHDTLANLGWLKPPHEANRVPNVKYNEANELVSNLQFGALKESKDYVHSEYKLMDNWKETERYDNVVPNNYKVKRFSQQPKSDMQPRPNHMGKGIHEMYGEDEVI